MAKRINQDLCIQCGACLASCPNEGISEVEAVYMIDPRLCQECSGFTGQSYCEESCPVGAVEEDTWEWGNAIKPIATTPAA